ncbi:MAG: 3-oxoacid CoA-transferase, partial [Clostridiales bacterium]|nr:3-oxoacid CoA-transferase [Clostridiales bacterium]
MAKFVTAEEAVAFVKDNDTVVFGGFCTYGTTEELTEALADRYERTGHPKNIDIISGITPGDKSESNEPRQGYNIGLNLLKAEGLIGGATVGLADARAIGYKINENKIAGYLMPMGILVNLFRATAGGAPGILTKVGLGTFCDPRQDGCCGNEMARQRGSVVELMEIDGEEYLFYKTYKPDVCFIRGTYADEDGNISMDHEVIIGAEFDMAAATHNKGGIVIVQVDKMVQRGSIHPKNVRIHGLLVDYVVVAQKPENTWQSFLSPVYRPELASEIKTVIGKRAPMKLDIRKVIARRST